MTKPLTLWLYPREGEWPDAIVHSLRPFGDERWQEYRALPAAEFDALVARAALAPSIPTPATDRCRLAQLEHLLATLRLPGNATRPVGQTLADLGWSEADEAPGPVEMRFERVSGTELPPAGGEGKP